MAQRITLPAFLKLVDDFEKAVEANSWKGSQSKEDRKQIKKEYEDAKANLRREIFNLY